MDVEDATAGWVDWYNNRRLQVGLEGLPESIETVWPHTVTQTRVVHLIRACMRYVAYGDRKATAALLRPIYTAANEQAALDALATFADSNIGKKHPGAVAVGERFIPFLAFPSEVRKIIYTTNAIVISSPPNACTRFPARAGLWL